MPDISQYEDKNEYQRQWRLENPEKIGKYNCSRDHEKVREKAWERRYGITRKDYNEMLWSQGGVCAICGTDTIGRGHKYFHVDHDHKTGSVRGLLCDLCNRGLGYFKDSPAFLERAADYLKKIPILCKTPKPERLEGAEE